MSRLTSKDLGLNVKDYENIQQTCSVAAVASNAFELNNATLQNSDIKQKNTNENLCMIRTVLDTGGNNADKVLNKMKDNFEINGTLLGTTPNNIQTNFKVVDLPSKKAIDIYNQCFIGVKQSNEINLSIGTYEAEIEQINESFAKCLIDNGAIIKTNPNQDGIFDTVSDPKLLRTNLETLPPEKVKQNNNYIFGGVGIISSFLISCSFLSVIIILLVLIKSNRNN